MRGGSADGIIEVRTQTDVVVQRGYSMEPDLLFDVDEAAPRVDAIIDVLKRRGFTRVKTYRWRKATELGEILLDLFIPPDADSANDPAGFTRLPAGDLALLRPGKLRVNLAAGSRNFVDTQAAIVAKPRLDPSTLAQGAAAAIGGAVATGVAGL